MSEFPFYRRLLAVAVPLLTLVIGWHLGEQYTQRQLTVATTLPATMSGKVLLNPEKQANLSILWETWRKLNEYYVSPQDLDGQKLVLGAAAGLVRGVGDPYTVFMSPTENKNFQLSMGGELDGIGAQLAQKDGVLTIVAPLKASPAEKAGLLPEDIIAKINDESTSSLSLDDAVQRIRGKKGTTVTLTLYRKGNPAPVIIAVIRDHIAVPSTQSKVLPQPGGPIGYIELSQFGQHSVSEISNALQDFQKQNVKGIILDLRYNGGGYLDAAVELVSLFLDKGRVVTVKHRALEADEVMNVNGKVVYPTIPLVVLINEGSASASEIVAGALQDHHRATIVGVKSFGKGTVQDILDLPGGSSLRVTVAHWYTPNGKNLGKEGVTPDVKVSITADDFKAGKDPQLDKALQVVTKK